MLTGWFALIGVVATILLAVGAVAARALTPWAGVVAAVFGIVIVLLVGFPYLALLVLFVAASSLATRYRIQEKKQKHVQEGRAGERGVSNVVAHILIPTAIAVAGGLPSEALRSPSTSLLFASALAFGASDTLASEFGVLAGRAKSILSREPVAPGTNGGVSRTGQVFALVGSVTTAVVGLGLFMAFGTSTIAPVAFVAVVTVVGFLGCQVDSVLGELFENRGLLSKGSTNFLGMLSAVGMSLLALQVLGVAL
ncbi:MAG TPA: DUF92 domain-containing protein [Thermoplasmata archaeon]|nr:DUF92 domain-containing protein [Thermoplasmata archaeon]